ncbi:hypothetical protein [Streptomyces carminius]|nr:hypothetical protein [Streptomyces carminius]
MTMYEVRIMKAGEWPELREARLEALADPVAPVAFLERYAER